jgi:putative dimethyl sulfoxide reductase chaperone
MSQASKNLNSQASAKYHHWAEMAVFLSRTFEKEVDDAFLQVIIEAAPGLVRWAQSQNQPELLNGSHLLDQFLQQATAQENHAELIEQLSVEFASLFYGMGINPVNVIESVYLGEEQILYETPYFQVVELYRLFDYEKLPNFNEPEDHIANELDFLAFQLRSAAWALEKGDENDFKERVNAAKDFVDNHLNRWAPDFCTAVLKATQNLFYRAGAYLTLGMLMQLSSAGYGIE